MLVVPVHQLFGDLVSVRLGFGCIDRLLDRPPRGALAHLDADTGLSAIPGEGVCY